MVTLEITDSRINMMQLQGKQVKLAASLPLEPGLVVEGVVADSVAVGQRIKELMAAYAISERRVVVGVSGMHTIYRTFNLPKLPGGMLNEAVNREIERVLPVPRSEVYLSWQAIPFTETEITICAVGLPRSTMDSITETLREAELESRLMDVSPLALSRVVDDSNAIVVNVHATGFDIVVMLDGIPRLLRSMSASSRSAALPEIVSMLREELDRTVAFFDSSREGYPKIGNLPLYVAGETSQVVAGQLNRQVTPLPQWFYLPEGVDINHYVVNIGLALKQIRVGSVQSRIDMNVIPEAYRPRPFPTMQVVSWAVILIALIAIVPTAMSTYRSFAMTEELRDQLALLEGRTEDVKSGAAEIVKLKTNLDEANAGLAILKQPITNAGEQRKVVNQKLARVTGLKPGHVDLTTIVFNGATDLLVSGTSPDDTLVLNYATALKDSGTFTKVVVQQLIKQEFNKWVFTISLN